MAIKTKSKASISRLRGEPFFNLAVARGGSYLASTVHAEGRIRQLQETVNDFIREFGAGELPYFFQEMESWLAERGYDLCVAAVAHFREHGTPPPLPVVAQKNARTKAKQIGSRPANARKVSGDEETLESGYAEVA